MASCYCSLAGTKACRYCSNNPNAETPPVLRTNTVFTTDTVLITGIKTNADRIRAMTDEELAYMLVDIGECDRRCPAKTDTCIFSDSTCRMAWLDWLKQEVDDETN